MGRIVDFSTCLKAHPYYLGTIRIWVPPVERLQKIPPFLQEAMRKLCGVVLQDVAAASREAEEIRKLLQASEAPDLADAICALVAMHERRFQLALQAAEQAIMACPDCADYYYLIGVIATQARDMPLSVAALRRATELNPQHGFALASLALIYTLNQNWAEALSAARIAKQYTGNKIYYVDLCLLASCWQLKLPNESTLLLDALRSREVDSAKLLKWLPTVTWCLDAKIVKEARSVFFVYGDLNYLFEHIVPLVWSLAAVKPKKAHLHIHINANPHPFIPRILEELRCRSGLSLSWSSESIDPFSYGHVKVYHSCVRFCRFLQFIEIVKCPVYSIDADSLFHRSPDEFDIFDDSECDIALQYNPDHPLWELCVAIGVFIRPTPESLRYLRMVAEFIVHNIKEGRGRWFLDQIGLSLAFNQLHSTLSFKALPFQIFCDQSFGDDAMVWSVTVQKNADDAYNRLKRELLAHYGEPRVLSAPTECDDARYVVSLFGPMFIDIHEEIAIKNISTHGLTDSKELLFLWRHLSKGDIVVDIGPGIGMATMAFASWTGSEGKVYLFEPQQVFRKILRSSLDLNGWQHAQICGKLEEILEVNHCRLIRIDDKAYEAVVTLLTPFLSRCRPLLYIIDLQNKKDWIAMLKQQNYRLYLHQGSERVNMVALPVEGNFSSDGLSVLTD